LSYALSKKEPVDGKTVYYTCRGRSVRPHVLGIVLDTGLEPNGRACMGWFPRPGDKSVVDCHVNNSGVED